MSKIANNEKRLNFLFIVQTTIIDKAIINRADIDKGRMKGESLRRLGKMCDAVRASYMIPDDKDSIEAACEFLGFFIYKDRELPNWLYELRNIGANQ